MLFTIPNRAASLLLAATVLAAASCSTKFDVAAPYKDITAVYGLLSMNDSGNAHYIRIQKAFLDENTSALVMAQIPDSSYYDSLRVTMQELNNGAVVDTFSLQRVNLLPKASGQFFNDTNYVYRFVRVLNPAHRYRLRIVNPKTSAEITGETGVIDTSATVFRVSQFTAGQFAIDIPKDTDVNAKTFKLNIVPPSGFEPGSGRYYEASMRIKYVDKVVSTGQQTDRFVDWNFYSAAGSASFVNVELSDVSFYSFVSSSIGPAPSGVQRYIDSFDVSVRMAAADYNQYRILTAARGGLTADQIQANFTNLTGPNVLGLLSTRAYRTRYNVPVGEETLQRLINSSITRSLGIAGRSDH